MVEVAMTEVEIKLPVPDRQKLIEDLIGLGFKTGNTILETDVYFDSSEEEIRKNGEALRIRRIQNLETGELCSVITFKGKKLDQVSMARQELEAGISDAETVLQILTAIGFSPIRPKVVKKRQQYHWNRMAACVDQVQDLGDFLELEIVIGEEERKAQALEKIEEILYKLGFQMSDTTRTSYLSMLQNRED